MIYGGFDHVAFNSQPTNNQVWFVLPSISWWNFAWRKSLFDQLLEARGCIRHS